MIIADRGERDHRPGGRWSTPRLVDDLLALASLERAAAQVVTGWVPKIGELGDKLALAAELEGHLVRASALRQHALCFLERDDTRLTAAPAWVEPLRALDAHGSPVEVVDGVLGGVRRVLRSRYRRLVEVLDPMLDARLRATVVAALDALDSGVSPIGTPRPCRAGGTEIAAALEAAWRADPGPRVVDRRGRLGTGRPRARPGAPGRPTPAARSGPGPTSAGARAAPSRIWPVS